MKKFTVAVLLVALCMSAFCAPAKEKKAADVPAEVKVEVKEEVKKVPGEIRIGALKGPTTMGLVRLLDLAENNHTENTYKFTMAAAADELTPLLLRGELDILAVPVNLGSVLYNKTKGQIKIAAVNTLGVLYIVEKGGDSIKSIADLKGCTVFATGKGTTPEATLNYLLEQNGLKAGTDVDIQFKSEPTEVVAAMKNAEHAVAMLPQPFVTVASTQISDLRVALDLTEQWNKLDNGSSLVTGCFIVRSDYAQNNPDAVDIFLSEAAASAEFTATNVAEAAELVAKYGIVPKAPIAMKALPNCHIVCISGEEMKSMVSGYLKVLFDSKPAMVGGAMPADDFYIVK